VVALALGMFSIAGAQTYGVSVYIDNKAVTFPDQKPFIDKNNRTLVPIRFIAEEMKAEVGWDAPRKLVTIDKGNISIELLIGEKRATVNGSVKTFDTSAVIYTNRTMVPLRFISETLDADVDWDKDTRTVYIWTGAVEKVPVKPAQPGVTPYEGAKPITPSEWKTADGTAEVMRWDNPVIKYITMADLPAEIDSNKIMNIDIDDKFVNVTLINTNNHRSIPTLFLAEGKDITRVRNLKDFTSIDDTRYLQKYAIKATYDTHPDLGNLPTKTDITKVTHFIFDGIRNDQTRLLAVENPFYGGAR
jgi:hypothetical protein